MLLAYRGLHSGGNARWVMDWGLQMSKLLINKLSGLYLGTHLQEMVGVATGIDGKQAAQQLLVHVSHVEGMRRPILNIMADSIACYIIFPASITANIVVGI